MSRAPVRLSDHEHHGSCGCCGHVVEGPVHIVVSRTVPRTDEIHVPFHCARCVAEFQTQQPTGESPRTYARLSVGWTPRGLQVWCVRHNLNVLHVDFEGQRHPAA
jgi:hypothetical protein